MTPIKAIPKGSEADRPPPRDRRFTARNAAGLPIGHGSTPQEALARAADLWMEPAAWIEERQRSYPFRVWMRVRVGPEPAQREPRSVEESVEQYNRARRERTKEQA